MKKTHIAALLASMTLLGSGVAFAAPGISISSSVPGINMPVTAAAEEPLTREPKTQIQVISDEENTVSADFITASVPESFPAEPRVEVTVIPAPVPQSVQPIQPIQPVQHAQPAQKEQKTEIASENNASIAVTGSAPAAISQTPLHEVCNNVKLGEAWAGTGVACRTGGQEAPAINPALPVNPMSEYAHLVRNIVAPWCGYVNVLVDDPSVINGDIYGMSWWGTNKIGIRSGIPMAITKDMALHECGHILQARVFPNKQDAVNRLNALHGTNYAIETNARCISAYLHPGAQPIGVGSGATARWNSAECAGVAGESAIKIIQGIRP